jgi:hypothetical protein
MSKEYLGDSVYADIEDGMVKLTTENGYPDDPRNVIFLEPEVYRALQDLLRATRTEVTAPPPDGAQVLERLNGRRVVASISGGKDSAAMGLWLMEQGIEYDRVFADTGWEHPLTYEYLCDPRLGEPSPDLLCYR